MKSLQKAAKDQNFNLVDWLITLLEVTGYYSFNRFMVKQGFNIKFALYIHSVVAAKKKEMQKGLDFYPTIGLY